MVKEDMQEVESESESFDSVLLQTQETHTPMHTHTHAYTPEKLTAARTSSKTRLWPLSLSPN